jgi:hypothetical protein
VALLVRAPFQLPPVIEIKTKPQRLIRAILGHIVSAKSELDDATFDQLAREFIFDGAVSLPEEINVFYWIYPYPVQVVIRDVGMPSKRGDFSSFIFLPPIEIFPSRLSRVNGRRI